MIHIKKILCPTDFSDASVNAFRYAYEFARSMGAEVVVVHVVESLPIMSGDAAVAFVPIEADLEKAAEVELTKLLADDKFKCITITRVVLVGEPADVILQQAKTQDVDLIILGSYGRSGISRLIMGSVAEAVTRKAPCPVLIVKANEKEFIAEK